MNGLIRLIKKVYFLSLIVLFSFCSISYAEKTQSNSGPKYKLVRGLKNIATSPAEIAKHMIIEAAHAKPDFLGSVYGAFYGSMKGAGLGLARFGSGLCDVFTFPARHDDTWNALFPLPPFTFEETRKSIEAN